MEYCPCGGDLVEPAQYEIKDGGKERVRAPKAKNHTQVLRYPPPWKFHRSAIRKCFIKVFNVDRQWISSRSTTSSTMHMAPRDGGQLLIREKVFLHIGNVPGFPSRSNGKSFLVLFS